MAEYTSVYRFFALAYSLRHTFALSQTEHSFGKKVVLYLEAVCKSPLDARIYCSTDR
jgi:hypothetical protein